MINIDEGYLLFTTHVIPYLIIPFYWFIYPSFNREISQYYLSTDNNNIRTQFIKNCP